MENTTRAKFETDTSPTIKAGESVGRQALRWLESQPQWFQELVHRPSYRERLAEERRAELAVAQAALDAAAREIREGLQASARSEEQVFH